MAPELEIFERLVGVSQALSELPPATSDEDLAKRQKIAALFMQLMDELQEAFRFYRIH